MIDVAAPGQGLLTDAFYGSANQLERLIDESHGADHRGIKIPLSSLLGDQGTNDSLALHPARPNSWRMAAASEQRRTAIRRFMAAHGLKAKPWAIKAGLSPKTLSNFLNRKAESLTHTSLDKLARAADATIAELIGERPSQPRSGRDVVTVQGLRVAASMGGGIDIAEEPTGEPFYFRRNFIERLSRGKPIRLRVIELTGDSMQPTLHEGDVALVDLNSSDVGQTPGIYCIWSATGLQVKRVTALPGARPKLRIQSDNRALYEQADEVDAEDVRIIGRVVWRGGLV